MFPAVDFHPIAPIILMDPIPTGFQHGQGLSQSGDHQSQPGKIVHIKKWPMQMAGHWRSFFHNRQQPHSHLPNIDGLVKSRNARNHASQKQNDTEHGTSFSWLFTKTTILSCSNAKHSSGEIQIPSPRMSVAVDEIDIPGGKKAFFSPRSHVTFVQRQPSLSTGLLLYLPIAALQEMAACQD